ncbi:MAG: secretin N-terminal domain-containing protein, partial [Planctomycetales bacterium]
ETAVEEEDHVPQTPLRSRFAPKNSDPEENVNIPVSDRVVERAVKLKRAKVDQVEQQLRDLLGERLIRDKSRGGWSLTDAEGRNLHIKPDAARQVIQLQGPEALADQLEKLIRMLERPRQEGTLQTRVLPLRGADPEKVQQAVRAYRTGTTHPAPEQESPAKPADDQKPIEKKSIDEKKSSSSYHRKKVNQISDEEQADNSGPIRLAAFQESPASPQGTVILPVPVPGNAAPGDDMSTTEKLRNLGADIEVETLPDLDVIILRGNERDVQELTRIIQEIERLSEEAEPVIEVYSLKNVNGESLSLLIKQTQPDLIGWRQGRVSVTPLIKPNALLLIGWGEAIKAVKELISKLDQPVNPETEFQVFQLKHAPVATARTTLQEFFINKTGLAAKVQVIADLRTNSLIVQAAPQDLREAERLVRQLDTPAGQAVNQARVVKLRNSLAADLGQILGTAIKAARGGTGAGANAEKSAVLELLMIDPQGEKVLKSGILSDVNITPDPRTNTLLVSAPAESMDLVIALIHQLDEMPSDVAQIKVFRVVNGDVRELVRMLNSLFPAAGPPGSQPKLANTPGESALVPVRFSVDLRTNSIIATGSAGDLRVVEALLLRLDEKDVKQRQTTVYRLKNAPADKVATAVNQFLNSERQLERGAPGIASAFQQMEREVVVVPERNGNYLIISAAPRYFNEIKDLVEKLDAEPPEVMIQVLIAEVTLNNTDEFGVELGLQDSILFDRSLLGNLVSTTTTTQQSTPAGIITSTQQNILGASNTPGFLFNNQQLGNSGGDKALQNSNLIGGQGLSSFNVGRMNNDLGFGGLVLSASSESVSVLIRALQESRRLEVLSRPQVRTLDNQPAYIQVGQRVPRITNTSVNNIGQVNSIALENIGLILGVTPRISPDNIVVMEIDAEKSDVGAEQDGIPVSISNSGTVIRSPKFNITTASTTVSASNGETIILGGLITKSTQSITRRVPYLSDVPLLGNAFRYDLMASKRTELLIIMTPHVIRDPLEAARLKQIESARMHWTSADVIEMNGNNGLFPELDGTRMLDVETPVIYPDANPRGVLPAPPEGDCPPDKLPAPLETPPSLPGPQDVQPQGGQQPANGPALSPAKGESSGSSPYVNELQQTGGEMPAGVASTRNQSSAPRKLGAGNSKAAPPKAQEKKTSREAAPQSIKPNSGPFWMRKKTEKTTASSPSEKSGS